MEEWAEGPAVMEGRECVGLRWSGVGVAGLRWSGVGVGSFRSGVGVGSFRSGVGVGSFRSEAEKCAYPPQRRNVPTPRSGEMCLPPVAEAVPGMPPGAEAVPGAPPAPQRKRPP